MHRIYVNARERERSTVWCRVKIVSFFPQLASSTALMSQKLLCSLSHTKNRYSEMKFEISKRTRRCAHRRCRRHRRAVVSNWRVRVENSSPLFCYAFDVLAAHALSIYQMPTTTTLSAPFCNISSCIALSMRQQTYSFIATAEGDVNERETRAAL